MKAFLLLSLALTQLAFAGEFTTEVTSIKKLIGCYEAKTSSLKLVIKPYGNDDICELNGGGFCTRKVSYVDSFGKSVKSFKANVISQNPAIGIAMLAADNFRLNEAYMIESVIYGEDKDIEAAVLRPFAPGSSVPGTPITYVRCGTTL